MDIIQFLEPVIDKRTEEIMSDFIKGESKENHQQFVKLLHSLDPELRHELENFYLNSVLEAVRFSYTKGLTEASELKTLL